MMLRYGRIGVTRPEQFPKPFVVYGQTTEITDRGRPRTEKRAEKARISGILSTAAPEERERFQQMGVRVSHTILQRGTPAAKENDTLAFVKNGVESRWFRVRAVHNKGEMDIDTLYYCEERGDVR